MNGSVGSVSGTEFVSESTIGGVLVYAIYQALLTALRTEAMRQRGVIDRHTQIRLVADTVWASVKEGAAVSAVLGVLLLVFLWMAFPFILGVFGAGKAPRIWSILSGMASQQKDISRRCLATLVYCRLLCGRQSMGFDSYPLCLIFRLWVRSEIGFRSFFWAWLILVSSYSGAMSDF